ncbi:MAG: energy transducer TonB [Terracidiphilus sp.]
MRTLSMCLVFLGLLAVPGFGQQEVAPSTQDGPLDIKPSPPAPDQDGVYRLGPGITPPVLTKAVPPEYPSNVDDRGPRHFLFRVVVGADGSVKMRDAIPNAQSDYLDNAITALKASTIQPGTLNGAPVPVLVCVRAIFSPFRPSSTEIVDCDQGQLRNGFGGPASSASANDPFKLPIGAEPPTVIHSVEAEFSDEARRDRIQGVVLLSMIVDEQGMPTEIRVERPAGHGLDENAVAAVSQYRFRPATLDGKPIAVRIRIEISFRSRN